MYTQGKEEDEEDMLCSILAQLEYRYQICTWDASGIPFRTYLYVPETHPITGCEFYEHEDFAHVLKVLYITLITSCMYILAASSDICVYYAENGQEHKTWWSQPTAVGSVHRSPL